MLLANRKSGGETSKMRVSGFGAGYTVKPIYGSNQINSRCAQNLLQLGFGEANVASMSGIRSLNQLRNRAFNPSAFRIKSGKFGRLLALPRLFQGDQFMFGE